MASSPCDSNPCEPRRCIRCNNCTSGYTCADNDMNAGFEFTMSIVTALLTLAHLQSRQAPGIIGGICAAGIVVIVTLLVVILVGLFLLWRRKSDVRTLTIQGQQRERFTYQSYYKKTQDVGGLKLERKQSKKTGSYNPGFEMHKKQKIFLPYPDMTQIDDVLPTAMTDHNFVYNALYDADNIEDDFLKETTTTQVTFSEPVNNVQLLNTSPVARSPVTAYENLNFEEDNEDFNQNDFMAKENFDAKKKRLSSVKRWRSSNKGVLEITPDPEVI